MYKFYTIKEEKSTNSPINVNDEKSQIEKTFKFNNETNIDEYSNILEEHDLEEIASIRQENKNNILDIISKDSLNISKKELDLNKDKIRQTSYDLNIYITKEIIIKKERFTKDLLIRRAKKILFDTLIKYDNYVISKVYNNHIGNGLKIKKIFRINYFQIKNTNTNFNKQLLKTPQGIILSSDISTRHSNFPSDHNKILIKELLNEENEEKRIFFNQLFSKTFSDFINHLIGKKKSYYLEGIENFYENELTHLGQKDKLKKILKLVINNFEKMFENKKPRKTKLQQ